MKSIMPIAFAFVALNACEASVSTPAQTTTTSARIEARRREIVPPSPPPTLPEERATIPESENPPPGTSVVETVTPTAEKRDRQITEKLRKAIQEDNTLSPEAKQVEIITTDRKVILKGRAHTEKERMDIDTKARAADDVIDVDDRIELVP